MELQALSRADLAVTSKPVSWIWDGFLAPGMMTLLTSQVLEDADQKATRAELLADWPADIPKPTPLSLWRWLDRALEEKRVGRDGTGRKRKPFRYWLPHKEAEWANDPMHAIMHPEPLDEDFWKELARPARQRTRKEATPT